MRRKTVATKRQASAPPLDEACVRRAIAVGCQVMRGRRGQVIAIRFFNSAKLSPSDRAYWRAQSAAADRRLLDDGGRILERPSPAGLLEARKIYLMPYCYTGLTDEQLRAALAASEYTNAAKRVERLRRHAALLHTADDLSKSIPTEQGQISSDPFWVELVQAEMLALAYDAAPSVERDAKTQLARKRGGKTAAERAKNSAAEWQSKLIDAARKTIAAGTAPHNVAGILAKRFHKTARTVRDVLRKSGILEKRK